MNDGIFLDNYFLQNKSITKEDFAAKLSFSRSKFFELFHEEIIPDKYKIEIENLLEIKFPVPEKVVDKEFEESKAQIEIRELSLKLYTSEEEKKILNEKVILFENQNLKSEERINQLTKQLKDAGIEPRE